MQRPMSTVVVGVLGGRAKADAIAVAATTPAPTFPVPLLNGALPPVELA